MEKREGLCFRCEHRVLSHETRSEDMIRLDGMLRSYGEICYELLTGEEIKCYGKPEKLDEKRIKILKDRKKQIEEDIAEIIKVGRFCIGHQPRCECGNWDSANWACYMYDPVAPVVLAPLNKDDKRPQFGPWMISSRSKFVRVYEGQLAVKEVEDGSLKYYLPEETSEEKN